MNKRKISRYVTREGCKVTHIHSLNEQHGRIETEIVLSSSELKTLGQPELRLVDWDKGHEHTFRPR